MVNAATLALLLLLLLCASSCAAAEDKPADSPAESPSKGKPGVGLDEACKHTPDPAFCGLFLQPHAAIFAKNDLKKMGFTALNATVSQVKSTKSFMTREAFNDKKSKVHSAMMTCVGRIARGESNLKMAAREFSDSDSQAQRKPHKADPRKMVDSATSELNACLEVLKTTYDGGDLSEEATDLAMTAMRKVKDSVIACNVSKSFIP